MSMQAARTANSKVRPNLANSSDGDLSTMDGMLDAIRARRDFQDLGTYRVQPTSGGSSYVLVTVSCRYDVWATARDLRTFAASLESDGWITSGVSNLPFDRFLVTGRRVPIGILVEGQVVHVEPGDLGIKPISGGSPVAECDHYAPGSWFSGTDARCEKLHPDRLADWCDSCRTAYIESLATGDDWMGGLVDGTPTPGFTDPESRAIIDEAMALRSDLDLEAFVRPTPHSDEAYCDFLAWEHDKGNSDLPYPGIDSGWDDAEHEPFSPSADDEAACAAMVHGGNHDGQFDPNEICLWTMAEAEYRAGLEGDRSDDVEYRTGRFTYMPNP